MIKDLPVPSPGRGGVEHLPKGKTMSKNDWDLGFGITSSFSRNTSGNKKGITPQMVLGLIMKQYVKRSEYFRRLIQLTMFPTFCPTINRE